MNIQFISKYLADLHQRCSQYHNILSLILILASIYLIVLSATSQAQEIDNSSDKGALFFYDDYASILKQYVDDEALVAYKSLQANRQRLDNFVALLEGVQDSTYNKWTSTEKIAFWINAYNALTLVAIIDHYPIKASGLSSFRFPENSIRQIPGVWKKLQFTVKGKRVTLDEIEHKILRAQFKEARIHMALVCASIGCPPLRNEPYTGAQLEKQLDDQSRLFLSLSRNFKIDRARKKVYLSSIFNWFKSDFEVQNSPGKSISGQGKALSAVLNFIAKYLSANQRNYLLQASYSIDYLEYDWSLNGQ
ncbi:DUF547 domain-containing protein [candidate division CSSED10-310 bacterium]|uniref:DUF547 domain-containing protein n=1 Tax=candidate division CSSED10-310 bacterium TaxID=2855610 RepID=A0ABV6YYL6_UNCC1